MTSSHSQCSKQTQNQTVLRHSSQLQVKPKNLHEIFWDWPMTIQEIIYSKFSSKLINDCYRTKVLSLNWRDYQIGFNCFYEACQTYISQITCDSHTWCFYSIDTVLSVNSLFLKQVSNAWPLAKATSDWIRNSTVRHTYSIVRKICALRFCFDFLICTSLLYFSNRFSCFDPDT
jgi:hypothetical protein